MLTNESLQVQCLPRIPIKTPIKTHLTGLLHATADVEAKNAVYGAKLDPTEYGQDDDNGGTVILWPKGWQYAVGRIEHGGSAERFRLYGWYTEAELLKAGYGVEEDPFTDEPTIDGRDLEDDASDIKW